MAINNVSELDLGTFLQIIYSKGIYHQTSRDYTDWEMIKMNNLKISPGRQYDFQLSTSLAPASTQRRNPGAANRAFPKGFRIEHGEFSAKFKEIQTTIEVDGQLLARAAETPEKYAEVWATQAELSMDGARRVMASELYRDGTGALGHVASASIASGDVLVTLKASQRDSSITATYGISYAGWFELDDIILPLNRDGFTPSAMTGATYLKVLSIDELAGTVEFTGLDDQYEEIAITGAPAADEVLYRYDQQIFPNFASLGDFGETSTSIVGLESLAAGDGRLVHGMTLSGALAGTNIDAGGQSIDVKFLEKALNAGKRKTGPTRYDWKKLCTSYQTRSALIESKESDRRFVAVTDNSRGSADFNFVHGESQLKLTTSEYIPEDALWMLPETKGSGDKVLEYVGDEMKVAKYGNMPDFHFKHIASGQRVDVVEQHMRGVNLLLCKHPAAILSVTNFKNQ
jgi:hypothetical protein